MWIAGKRPSELGISLGARREDLKLALLCSSAFLLALTPLAVLVAGSFPPRSPEAREAVISLLQAPVVALAEEYLFRGYLFYLLGKASKDERWLILSSSALFALAHLPLKGPAYLLTFFPGLLMGWLRLKSGSILPSSLFHALGNAWAIWFSPLP